MYLVSSKIKEYKPDIRACIISYLVLINTPNITTQWLRNKYFKYLQIMLSLCFLCNGSKWFESCLLFCYHELVELLPLYLLDVYTSSHCSVVSHAVTYPWWISAAPWREPHAHAHTRTRAHSHTRSGVTSCNVREPATILNTITDETLTNNKSKLYLIL